MHLSYIVTQIIKFSTPEDEAVENKEEDNIEDEREEKVENKEEENVEMKKI